MESPDAKRTILRIVGNASSLILYLAPLMTVYKVWRSGSTRRFPCLPYIAALSNCFALMLYGNLAVHPKRFQFIAINATGAFLELFYINIFIVYSPERCQITKVLVVQLISITALGLVALTAFHSRERRTLFAGVLATLCCIAMYASPLSSMRHVIVKKSVKRMQLPLAIFGLANAVVETAYAKFHFDIFLTISNGLGILLSIIQLILYVKYYRTTNWDEEEDDADGSERLY